MPDNHSGIQQTSSGLPPKMTVLARQLAKQNSPASVQPFGHQQNDSSMMGLVTPERIIRVLSRKWKTVILVTAFGATLAFFYLWTTLRVYRAVSLIEMSQRRPRIMNQQSAVIEDTGYSPSEEIFNTRLKKFNGQELREIAFGRFKALYPAKGRSDSDLKALIGGATFTLLGKTRIVQISYESGDPELAAAVANAYAEAAEQSTIEENRKIAESAVAWLQVQADGQRQALEKVEATIVAFRTENKVDVLESEQKSNQDAILSLRKSLVDLEGQLVLARDMVGALSTLEVSPKCW
jgi:uncharacterized protein involved in exopolysaccharide biosynthesis